MSVMKTCPPFIIRGYTITGDAIHRLFWTTRLNRR